MVRSGDKLFLVEKGDAVFINSRIVHSTEAVAANTKYCMVQFEIASYVNSYSQSMDLYRFVIDKNNRIVVFKRDNEITKELYSYIDKPIDEISQRKSGYEYFINACVYNILGFLCRNEIIFDEKERDNADAIKKILPVLKFIEQNYYEHITLASLSELVNFDGSYLCRLFKKATNSTFIEYLNFVRICRAEKLLSQSSKTITEISAEVGFSSVSYFNKVFKKVEKCTPSSYKKIKFAQQPQNYTLYNTEVHSFIGNQKFV